MSLVLEIYKAKTAFEIFGIENQDVPITDLRIKEQINKRYKHLCLSLHPDRCKHPKATAAFQKMCNAKTFLESKPPKPRPPPRQRDPKVLKEIENTKTKLENAILKKEACVRRVKREAFNIYKIDKLLPTELKLVQEKLQIDDVKKKLTNAKKFATILQNTLINLKSKN